MSRRMIGRARPGWRSARAGEDLARAALAEKQLVADELAAIEEELAALDDQMEHLNDEISQLQQKLNDARAKEKSLVMRSRTVSDRIKVKRQVNREVLDDAFARFEHFERRMDQLQGQAEAMDLAAKASRTWRRKSTTWPTTTG